jgi:hypothetical protein
MKKNDLLIQLDGGLGNQLFQISAGNYFAKTFGKTLKLKLPLTNYENKKKNQLLNTISTQNEIYENKLLYFKYLRFLWRIDRKLIKLSKFYSLIRRVQDLHNLAEINEIQLLNSTKELRGYFQSSFFASYSRNIISSILNGIELSNTASKLSTKIQIEKPVGVHIRRGDYIKLENLYGLLSEEYYELIFKDILKNKPNQKFWIFSNEIQKIEELFSKSKYFRHLYFVDHEQKLTDLESLVLYSKCSGHITGNSTFSWWGAFISDNCELVYAPEPWNKKIKYSTNLLPLSWIKRKSIWEN